MNKIKATQFKDQQPKLTWIISFMKRNKLSHKKAEMMSSATKLNTANPFIIYDFFNQLEVSDDSNRKLTDYLQMCLHIFCPVNVCIYIVLLIAMKNSFSV